MTKKTKRKMNAYMKARIELSCVIRKKEDLPGGKKGMKKLAKIIKEVMKKAGVVNYKESGSRIGIAIRRTKAMQKALKYYKSN